jgi:hypothetical protein
LVEHAERATHVEDDVEADRGVAVFQPAHGVASAAGTLGDLLDGEPLELAPGAEVVSEVCGGTDRSVWKWTGHSGS